MRKIYRKCLAIALVMILAIASLTVAADADIDWQVLGNTYYARGKVLEKTFRVYSEIVYVAYRTDESPKTIIVKKLEDKRWQDVGSTLQCENMTKGLSIDIKNGVPYIAYCQSFVQTDGSYDSKFTIKRLVNNYWEVFGCQELKGTKIDEIAYQIDKGTSYVAYKTVQGAEPAASNSITVMKYSGTAWSTVGSAGFMSGRLPDLMLCVANGTPYVASRNSDTNMLKVMKLSADKWESIGKDVNNEGYEVSMDVYGNIPYIAFSNSKDKITVKKFVDGDWKDIGGVSDSGRLGVPDIQAGNSVLWLCYVKNEKINVLKYDGTAWETIGTGMADATAIQAIAANNSLYIEYSGLSDTEGLRITRINP